MAWLAVDKDGTELIFSKIIRPYRFLGRHWNNFEHDIIVLPKGSIEKLIGRKLTWEDEPVELKGE